MGVGTQSRPAPGRGRDLGRSGRRRRALQYLQQVPGRAHAHVDVGIADQSLLQSIKLLDALARSSLRENLLFDLLELSFQGLDDGELAVNHRVHECIQHKACAVLE